MKPSTHSGKSCEIRPNDPLGHGNLGLALRKADRHDEAIRSFEHAVSLDPRLASHHNHLGLSLSDAGRLDDALASLRRAVELDPKSAEFRENLGLTLLLNGNFEEGWPQYESRHQLERFKSRRPAIDVPMWQGEPVANRSILVYSEQGFGDTIQFVRYVPLLASMGASVTLAVQPRLIPLLSVLSNAASVIAIGEVHGRFDFQCALLSLPHGFRTTLANVPADVPYLSADNALVARWREHIGRDGFKIGISWRGSPNYQADHHRSIPLREFAPLAAIPGMRLISLQKGLGADQVAGVEFRVETLDERFDEAGAFVDSAALMMALDLVVSCDTSILHLAGALARPLFVALRRVPDWRWLLDREDSPWYPTARLFRQRSVGDWSDVFDRIAVETRALAGTREFLTENEQRYFLLAQDSKTAALTGTNFHALHYRAGRTGGINENHDYCRGRCRGPRLCAGHSACGPRGEHRPWRGHRPIGVRSGGRRRRRRGRLYRRQRHRPLLGPLAAASPAAGAQSPPAERLEPSIYRSSPRKRGPSAQE